MGKYLEKAITSFLKDNGIAHGSFKIEQKSIFFSWMDGNAKYFSFLEFEGEFDLYGMCFTDCTEDGKLEGVEFYRN